MLEELGNLTKLTVTLEYVGSLAPRLVWSVNFKVFERVNSMSGNAMQIESSLVFLRNIQTKNYKCDIQFQTGRCERLETYCSWKHLPFVVNGSLTHGTHVLNIHFTPPKNSF